MNKILFPYSDTPVEFPFYTDNMVFYFDIEANGITLYLVASDIDKSNPVLLNKTSYGEELSLEMANSIADAIINKYALGSIEHMTIKTGATNINQSISLRGNEEAIHLSTGKATIVLRRLLTLGELDPYTLGDIDNKDVIMEVAL